MNQQNNNRRPPLKKREHNINQDVQHQTIRIVGEGIESRVVGRNEALKIAKEMELDLVEISPDATPPVCRICDYNKFLYDKKKREKDLKKKQEHSEIKELRLTPTTDEHDLEFKMRHAINWIKNGDKVKCSVFFKGRSIMYKEQGEMILLKIAQRLEDVAKVENLPRLEGKKMYMMLTPKKKK